jgi:hypothetical protein
MRRVPQKCRIRVKPNAEGSRHPSLRHGVEINREAIHIAQRSHTTLRSPPKRLSPNEPVSADAA